MKKRNDTGSPDNPRDRKYSEDPARGDRPQDLQRAIVRVKVADDRDPEIMNDPRIHASVKTHRHKKSIAGYGMHPGEVHTITVYEHEVEDLQRQCRTDGHRRLKEMADKLAKADFESWVQKRTGGILNDAGALDHEKEHALEIARAECPIHWAQYLETAAKMIGDEVGIDQYDARRGLPPLESVEVLRTIDPPDTRGNVARKAGDANANALRDGLRMLLEEMRAERDTKPKRGRKAANASD